MKSSNLLNMRALTSLISRFAIFTLLLPTSSALFSQSVWEARWISMPELERQAVAVLHFRKTFELETKPESFRVHVSADNRYQLLVNGESVSRGPARGDFRHWRYETVDLAEHLKSGKNVLAAVVWNFGDMIPEAQFSQQTAFILQGAEEASLMVNTDETWKVMENEAYDVIPSGEFQLYSYLVVGPGEVIDGNQWPWGWERADYDDSDWKEPVRLEPGYPRGSGTGALWMLVPRKIPQMIEEPLAPGMIRKGNNMNLSMQLNTNSRTTFLPNTRNTLVIDQERLVTAYPQLTLSGGAGATVKMTYAEAAFIKEGERWQLASRKGHRDSLRNREIIGNYDLFISNGEPNQTYTTLWWRTWRYLELEVNTQDDTLFLEGVSGLETRYPFEAVATFSSSLGRLEEVWKVGWRTAQLCAHETYVDCPYYEQLQYVGDTRIQALISLYVSGDDRLVRKAITDFDNSRIPEGLTQSRYPSSKEQIIPTYSLFWISMLHDYWMHRSDYDFVQQHLPGVESVLGWYERYVNEENLLEAHPWWNFVDWSWPWHEETRYGGVPPGNDTHSSILTLQLIYTLQQAEDLMQAFGEEEQAAEYHDLMVRLRDEAFRTYWSEERGLFADTPAKESFSQHANILAILTDAIPDYQQPELMENILRDASLTQATFYFRFYLNRALVKTGMGDRFIQELKPWFDMLDLGLTTFAEKPEPTRSDCHAWSASPNYEFLAAICGIRPAAPGFESVLIAPELGPLKYAKGSMPHPLGTISVDLVKRGENGIFAEITLPEGLEGEFVFEEQRKKLVSGENRMEW